MRERDGVGAQHLIDSRNERSARARDGERRWAAVVLATVQTAALVALGHTGGGCAGTGSAASPGAPGVALPEAHVGSTRDVSLMNLPSDYDPPSIPSEVFATLKGAADAHAELCAPDDQHPNFPEDADAVTRAFCQDLEPGGVVPTPRSLADLQKLLGLDFKDPNGGNGAGGNPAFALTGHSSSLVARFVSSINPRAIVFTPPPADGSKPTGFVIMAFTRGEQFVEVAVHDPTVDQINLYLIRFDQDCTEATGGCSYGDLLTPRIERGWSNVRVYESSSAMNDTVLDCLQCHQPNASAAKFLRMQEFSAPFTHFFSASTRGGTALLADFHAAHGATEDYGLIPASMIDKSDPSKLRDLITQAGFGAQPNAFDSEAIEAETAAMEGQPEVNVPMGQSSTWSQIHGNAVSGQDIATPYHDVKVTDPAKLSMMTDAYLQVMSGTASPETLPDIRAVFLDEGLPDMGFAPEVGLSGRALFFQECRDCHNSNLDQTISRARFNVDKFDELTADEAAIAVARLSQPSTSAQHMPPALFRTLRDDERQLMIQELQKFESSP